MSAKKKVSKKVTKKSENPKEKRLSSEEMSNMEVFYAEMNQYKAEMSAQEQYKKTKHLEIQNLELQARLMEKEIESENRLIQLKQEKYKNTELKLKNYIESMKEKYGVETNGSIKYDRMTGKILE